MTLVTWGAVLQEVLHVAALLAERGVQAEVIDVASLKPFDSQTVLESVEKTGRCVIVHEAPQTCGFGAEIAAMLAEHALHYLRAPVVRVTGYDTIMPYLQLEKSYLPSVARIMAGVESTLEFA